MDIIYYAEPVNKWCDPVHYHHFQHKLASFPAQVSNYAYPTCSWTFPMGFFSFLCACLSSTTAAHKWEHSNCTIILCWHSLSLLSSCDAGLICSLHTASWCKLKCCQHRCCWEAGPQDPTCSPVLCVMHTHWPPRATTSGVVANKTLPTVVQGLVHNEWTITVSYLLPHDQRCRHALRAMSGNIATSVSRPHLFAHLRTKEESSN